MATLENKLVKNTYKDLLKLSAGDNEGLNGSTLITIEDGEGTDSALQVSTAGIKSTGTLAVDGASTLTGNTTIGGTLGVSGNATFDTNTLFVDATNNRVGIGTTSPAYPLDVNGSIYVGGGSGGSATATQSIFQDIYGGIRSAIYVRNTADYATGRGSGYSIQNGNGVEKAWFQISSNDGTQNGYSLILGNSGGNLTISSSGAATFSSSVTATSFITSSDSRSKENIELANLQICYDNVKNLKLKRFGFKKEIFSDEQMQDRNQIGFIAQEVEEIFPNAIHKRKLTYNQKFEDVVIPAKFDENGIEIESEKTEKKLISEDVIEDFRGLDKNQIEMALYGAVQYLIAKVEALEAK